MLDTLLSVIIPVHNEEKTICKTVDSLLIQDYYPFEIIIVDDGSTDKTSVKLIESFTLNQISFEQQENCLNSKKIVRFWYAICQNVLLFLLEKENGGKSDALNAGISFCKGEYFVCVDADCILANDTIKNLVLS